jgi:hypothetical protein
VEQTKSDMAATGLDVKDAKRKSASRPTTPDSSIEIEGPQEVQDLTLKFVFQSTGAASVKARLILPSNWFR